MLGSWGVGTGSLARKNCTGRKPRQIHTADLRHLVGIQADSPGIKPDQFFVYSNGKQREKKIVNVDRYKYNCSYL